MSVQYKFFHISCCNPAESDNELNIFLRSHRVVTVHREFVGDRGNSFWSFVVEFLAVEPKNNSRQSSGKGKPRIDYKEVLSAEDFQVFATLRDWRKQAAAESGVPVYTIFTNEQLAKIVTDRVYSKTALRSIEGIGESRVEKYGAAVLQRMRELTAPTRAE